MNRKFLKPISTIVIMAFLLFPQSVYALPEGEQVVAGQASFDRSVPDTLNINQSTDQLIANYQSFSIGVPEAVHFFQPSSSSIALNRVIGGNPSSILGTLTANGRIFLVNPNGVLFGSGAVVDTAGLVASTLNISDSDFLAGRYTFFGPGGAVVNQGYISSPGGYVALLGNSVENAGVIEANLGSIALVSGEALTLDLDPQGIISVVVDTAVTQNLEAKKDAVKNTGSMTADGGKVILTAKALNGVFDKAINTEGIIEANALNDVGGEIILEANQRVNVAGDVIAKGGTVNVDVQGADITANVQAREAIFNMNDGDTVIDGASYSGDGGNNGTYSGTGSLTLMDNKHISVIGALAVTDGNLSLYADNDDDGIGDLDILADLLLDGGDIRLSGVNVNIQNATVKSEGFGGGDNSIHIGISSHHDGKLTITDSNVMAILTTDGSAVVELDSEDGDIEIARSTLLAEIGSGLTSAIVDLETAGDMYFEDSVVKAHVKGDGTATINMNMNPCYEDPNCNPDAIPNEEGDIVIQNTQMTALVDGAGSANVQNNAEGRLEITDGSFILAQINSGTTTSSINLYSNFGEDIFIQDSTVKAYVVTDGNAYTNLRTNYNSDGSIAIENSYVGAEVDGSGIAYVDIRAYEGVAISDSRQSGGKGIKGYVGGTTGSTDMQISTSKDASTKGAGGDIAINNSDIISQTIGVGRSSFNLDAGDWSGSAYGGLISIIDSMLLTSQGGSTGQSYDGANLSINGGDIYIFNSEIKARTELGDGAAFIESHAAGDIDIIDSKLYSYVEGLSYKAGFWMGTDLGSLIMNGSTLDAQVGAFGPHTTFHSIDVAENITINDSTLSSTTDSDGKNTIVLDAGGEIDIADSNFNVEVKGSGMAHVRINSTGDGQISDTNIKAKVVVGCSAAVPYSCADDNSIVRIYSDNVNIERSLLATEVNGSGQARTEIIARNDGASGQVGDISLVDSTVSSDVDGKGRAVVNVITNGVWGGGTPNGSLEIVGSTIHTRIGEDSGGDLNPFTDVYQSYVRIDGNNALIEKSTIEALVDRDGDAQIDADMYNGNFDILGSTLRAEVTGDGTALVQTRANRVGSLGITDSLLQSKIGSAVNPRRIEDALGHYSMVNIFAQDDAQISDSALNALVDTDGTAWVAINVNGTKGVAIEDTDVRTVVGGAGHGDIDIRAWNGALNFDDTTVSSTKDSGTEGTEVELRAGQGIWIEDSTFESLATNDGDEFVDIYTANGDIDIINSTLQSQLGGNGQARVFVNANNGVVNIINAPRTLSAHAGSGTGETARLSILGDEVNIEDSRLEAIVDTIGNAFISITTDGPEGLEIKRSTLEALVGTLGDADININSTTGGGSVYIDDSILSVKTAAQPGGRGNEIEILAAEDIEIEISRLKSQVDSNGIEYVVLKSNNGDVRILSSELSSIIGGDGTAYTRVLAPSGSIGIFGNPASRIEAKVEGNGYSAVTLAAQGPQDVLYLTDSLAYAGVLGQGSSLVHLEGYKDVNLLDSTIISHVGSNSNEKIKIQVTDGNITNELMKRPSLKTAGLHMEAGGSIGEEFEPIETDVDQIWAIAHGGDVYIHEEDGVTLEDIQALGSTVDVLTHGDTIITNILAEGSGLLDPAEIFVRTTDGDVTVQGNVLAQNSSDGEAAVDITTDNGNVAVVNGGVSSVVNGDGVAAVALRAYQERGAGNSNITLVNSTVGASVTGTGHSEVGLVAYDGAISSEGGSLISAEFLGLLAKYGIGSSGSPINTDIGHLAAYSWDEGGIFINELNDINLGFLLEEDDWRMGASVAANNGIVHVVTPGDIIVNSIVAPMGGVFLRSTQNSIYAGEGWSPLGLEKFPGGQPGPDWIDYVKDIPSMDVFFTPWRNIYGVSDFSALKINPDPGPNVIAGGYSYFSAPNGTIGVGTQAVKNPAVSAQVQGIVRPGATAATLVSPAVGLDLSDGVPPGYVLYDDTNSLQGEGTFLSPNALNVGRRQTWPAPIDGVPPLLDNHPLKVHIEAFEGTLPALPPGFIPAAGLTLQISGFIPPPATVSLVPGTETLALIVNPLQGDFRAYYELLNDYRVVSIDPFAPTEFYAYHPLTPTDSSAFDEIALDWEAYEFIEDNINLKKTLAPFFEDQVQ